MNHTSDRTTTNPTAARAWTALLGGLFLLSSGCSVLPEQEGPQYEKAETLDSLEVPPELSMPRDGGDGLDLPQTATAAERAADAQARRGEEVLPEYENVEVMGRADMRWLQVKAEPEQVWSALTRFWEKEGFQLKKEAPRLGIMETQWAENRADIPTGPIRSVIGSVFPGLYAADTRDKFRVRLEEAEDGEVTEVYLTHYGVKEVTRGEDQTVWEPRPSDPELANEMLNRILVHLGVKKEQAERMIAGAEEQAPQARLVQDAGRPVLQVDERFARAWRRTGVALDRLGFVVSDRNRSEGIYYVQVVDLLKDAGKEDSGWFSGLFSDDEKEAISADEEYRLVVSGEGARSRIVVQDAEGGALDPAEAEKILDRLRLELR